MEEENKKLFDSISESEFEDKNEEVSVEPEMVEAPEEEDIELGELSGNTKKDVVIKQEDLTVEGEEKFLIAEIESATPGKPLLKDVDGNPIPPKQFNENDPSKKGYETKLKIEFKDNNYISLIPNIKWYISSREKDGKKVKVLNPWFRTNGLKEEDLEDKFVSEVSKLYIKYCKFTGEEIGKVSQQDFLNGLVGKKVKLVQWSQKYKGDDVYRIDIANFVK